MIYAKATRTTLKNTEQLATNSKLKVKVTTTFCSFLVSVAMLIAISAAPALAQLTSTMDPNESRLGSFYPEVIAQETVATKSVSLITTLDTGTEGVKASPNTATALGNAKDGDSANVQLAPLSAFKAKFKGPAKDSQILKATDYLGDKLTKPLNPLLKLCIGDGSGFDAVGMAFLTRPKQPLTFVLDKDQISNLEFDAGWTSYQVALFAAGDVNIPKSTVNVASPLTSKTGIPYKGTLQSRPAAVGFVTSKTAVVKSNSLMLDTGSLDTDVSPAFAKKLMGKDQAVKTPLVLEEVQLGLGDPKTTVIVKNVKATVKEDVDDMTIGQNVLQRFQTVWKLADATPTIGFTLRVRDGEPGSVKKKKDFISLGDLSVQARDEDQAGYQNLISGMSGTGYITMAPNGNLLVSNEATNAVQKFDQQGNLLETINDPQLLAPKGLALDQSGNLFVSSSGNNAILIFDPSGINVGEITGVSSPRGLAFGPEDDLYVSSFDTDSILQLDPSDGLLLNTFTSPGMGPEGLSFTEDGFLFVAGYKNNTIMLLDALASAPTLNIFTAGSPLNGPVGLFADSPLGKKDANRGPDSDYGLERLLVANQLGQQVLTIGPGGDILESLSTAGVPIGITSNFQIVLCDTNNDQKIDQTDIDNILADLGMTVAPGDPRDADGDGTITLHDASICVNFCSDGSTCSLP